MAWEGADNCGFFFLRPPRKLSWRHPPKGAFWKGWVLVLTEDPVLPLAFTAHHPLNEFQQLLAIMCHDPSHVSPLLLHLQAGLPDKTEEAQFNLKFG